MKLHLLKQGINREVMNLAIPNIVNNITVPLVGIVDLALMGHLSSVKYLDAVALGALIFNFIYSGLSFLRMGTTGMTAQDYGAGNKKEVILHLTRALAVAMGLALVIFLLQDPIAWLSFRALDSGQEIEKLAETYFYIRIYAAPATLGLYALSGWFIGMQNAKFPMYIALIVNLFNIAFNSLFIFVFNMSSAGVAYGTLIAQYTGFIFAIILFLKYYKPYLKYWKLSEMLDLKAFKRFFNVNKDIFIRTMCLIFSLSFFTAQSAKISPEILAVNTLLFQFLLIFSYFIDGFAYAAEAIVGKEKGRGNYEGLRLAVKSIFRMGMIASIIFTLFFLVAGDWLLLMLTDNSNVISESNPYMLWSAAVPVITFAAFIWDGIFIGATATKAMRNALLISTFIVYLPSVYILMPLFGNHGLWLALMLFMASRGIMLQLYSRKHIYNVRVFKS
ncbi:MAG: MATE family efflux transporter [Hyphomicrobiales bacterium]